MSDAPGANVELTDCAAAVRQDAAEEAAPLSEPCQAPGCGRRHGDHSPEEVTACLERWLVARAGQAAAR